MKILRDKNSGVELITNSILSNKPFSLTRIGLGEIRWIDWYIKGGINSNCDGRSHASTLANLIENEGVYGNCSEEFFTEFTNGLISSDISVFWFNKDGSNLMYQEQMNIFNKYSPDSTKIDIDSISCFENENYWTKSLAGKKVLVIYPFVETIKSQYKKRELIWTGEHAMKLPEFELKTYKPVWSMGGDRPHSSWFESLNHMKKEISEIDFDVALLGCSHYGIPLCNFIKTELNKSAIYLGGETQLIFGIKGKRWDQWSIVNRHYNEHWVRSFDDVPNGYNLLDGGSYW